MKRYAIFLLAAALCARSGLWAQEASDEPSGDSVLQTARDLYFSGTNQPAEPAPPAEPATPGQAYGDEGDWRDDNDEGDDRPYVPILIGFVPGLSVPMGIYDTSISLGAIGAINGSVYGCQLSGVFNIALGDVEGIQGAGVFNIAEGRVDGFQLAGVFNIAGGSTFSQAAGVFNMAGGTVEGVQAAGVFNMAERVDGIMAAGVVNMADEVNGAMFGLVNIVDELDGLAIGLVNIVGNGIYDIAVDYQFDTGMAYLTYRSGTPALYSSYYLGADSAALFDGTLGSGTVGMGIGHRFRFLFLTADVELGAETPVSFASFPFGCMLDGARWEDTFGSLRASFGFGDRRGKGVYFGIKADFSVNDPEGVPTNLRQAWGGPTADTLSLFGADLAIWPKWFMGIRF